MIEPITRPRPAAATPFETPPTLYIYGDVLDEIRLSGRWRRDQLAGGLLAGRRYADEAGHPYLVARGFVASRHADDITEFSRALRRGWQAARDERAKHLPDDAVLGWFIAPGAADAEPDRALLVLHNTFFNHPWQRGLWVPIDAMPRALHPDGDQLAEGPVAVIDTGGARPARAR